MKNFLQNRGGFIALYVAAFIFGWYLNPIGNCLRQDSLSAVHEDHEQCADEGTLPQAAEVLQILAPKATDQPDGDLSERQIALRQKIEERRRGAGLTEDDCRSTPLPH